MPAARQTATIWRYAIALLVVVVIVVVVVLGINNGPEYWQSVIVATLGALVGITELVSRYRDEPVAALMSLPAVIYIAVNAGAALGALYLIHVFNWRFNASGQALAVTQVLVAGLGSAAVFRSSLFTVVVGDAQIGVGPSAVLNVIMSAADRAVDRQRALIRAGLAAQIMKDFPFDRSAALLRYAAASMQNMSEDELKQVEARIMQLRDPQFSSVPDEVKSYMLGLWLLTLFGRKVLDRTVLQVVGALKRVQESNDARVVECLTKAGAPMTITELQRQTAMNYAIISQSLSALRDRGVVILEGTPGAETVQLAPPAQ